MCDMMPSEMDGSTLEVYTRGYANGIASVMGADPPPPDYTGWPNEAVEAQEDGEFSDRCCTRACDLEERKREKVGEGGKKGMRCGRWCDWVSPPWYRPLSTLDGRVLTGTQVERPEGAPARALVPNLHVELMDVELMRALVLCILFVCAVALLLGFRTFAFARSGREGGMSDSCGGESSGQET